MVIVMSKDKIEVNMNVYDIPIVIEELEKAQDTIKKLQQEKQQLENNRDKAIEYIEKYPCNTWYSVIKPNEDFREVKVIKHQEELINILKGDSDE